MRVAACCASCRVHVGQHVAASAGVVCTKLRYRTMRLLQSPRRARRDSISSGLYELIKANVSAFLRVAESTSGKTWQHQQWSVRIN